MPAWYKRWPERLLTAEFFRLSERARHTLSALFDLAGKSDVPDGGVRFGTIPATVRDVQTITGIPLRSQANALDELRTNGFLEDQEGVMVLPMFYTMQLPIDPKAADRKRLERDRDRDVMRDDYRDVTRPSPSKKNRSTDSASLTLSGIEPDWIVRLRAEVTELNERELRSLTLDERFALARFHALEFCGYRRSESKNREKAVGLATGLAWLVDRLGRDPAKADLTVREYLVLGRRIVKRIGRPIWHRPTDVEGEIVLETAP